MLPKYELRSRLFAPHLPVPQALDRVSMKTWRGRAEAKTAIRSTVTDNVGEIKNLIYLDEAILLLSQINVAIEGLKGSDYEAWISA